VLAEEVGVEKRSLGSEGLKVSAEGLGCMGMSEFYGAADEAEAEATIRRALELGVSFLDTADMYGPFTNEELALAWVLAQGDDLAPIPGTKRRSYLEENVAAAEIELGEEDLRRLDEAAPRGAAVGDRYADMSPVGL
jgi:aryl-alcohol dehydrogenase-like predicted oxidoreductase